MSYIISFRKINFCYGCNYFILAKWELQGRIRVHKQQIGDRECRKTKLSEHIDVCGRVQIYFFQEGQQKE